MSRHLHIVMHDVPWPADFGGVTDLYFKLKWLYAGGIKIHLHCFIKDRPAQPLLEKYCESVQYYPRKKLGGISVRLPYIVASRSSSTLIENLHCDDHPILFEGIHCTFPFFSGKLAAGRKVYLRLHNAEHKYYRRLAKLEHNFFKRLFFLNEARLLEKYEREIAPKLPVWCVSETDAQLFRNEFSADARFLPVFLPWDSVNIKNGAGDYCLYHGNLSVNENEKAATWLATQVFNDLGIPLVIAGHSPSGRLKLLLKKHPHVKLIADPNENEMQKLIENAQVNVLPSFNSTGVKLKLLNALFNGRYCIVNGAGTAGSGLDELCWVAESERDFKAAVLKYFSESFTENLARERDTALRGLYNNKENARRLSAWIW